jgi:hypothetical protein
LASVIVRPPANARTGLAASFVLRGVACAVWKPAPEC